MRSPAPITEQFVQEVIRTDFNEHHFKSSKLFVDTESYTIRGKRADILFAFKRGKFRIYTAVFEAKTRATLRDLKPIVNAQKIWKIALIFASLSYCAGFYFFQISIVLDLWKTIIFLAGFVGLILIYRLLLSKIGFTQGKSISAIEQLRKYPANEKWIAIAADTFVNPQDFKVLRHFCRQARIGLVLVAADRKMDIILRPIPDEALNQYIDQYKKSAEINAFFAETIRYFKTPSERRKSRIYLSNAACGVVMSLFLFMPFLYEVRNNPHQSEVRSEMSINTNSSHLRKNLPVKSGKDAEKTDNWIPKEACEIFSESKMSFLAINDVFLSETAAKERLAELQQLGLNQCHIAPSGCLQNDLPEGQYIVYINRIYQSFESANAKIIKLKDYLAERKVDCKDCKVLKINTNS